MTEWIIQSLYLLTGALICLFFIIFSYSSIREKKPRAAIISFITVLIFGPIWYGYYFLLTLEYPLLMIPIILVVLFIILFFAPLGKRKQIKIGAIATQVDERDVIFSREEYFPGNDKYEKYYKTHPELKDIDDKLRKLPELLEPGGRYYDPIRSKAIDDIFGIIRKFTTKVDGEINELKTDIDADYITAAIKDMVLSLGADDVGIAKLNPMFIYSHVGRGPEKWGAPIKNNHQFVIVFTCEMNHTHVESAPDLPITEETAEKYLKAAQIS